MRRWLTAFSLASLLAAPALAQQPATPPAQNPAQAQAPAANAAEIAFWTSIKDTKNPAELRAYLQAFPAGVFAPLAKVRIEELEKAAAAARAAPAPTPAPAQPAAFDLANPNAIRELQQKLYSLNYRVSRRDGVFDTTTQNAIREWQKTVGLPVTGAVDQQQWERMRSAKTSTTWAAVAYTANGAFGSTFNRASREEAEQEATRECKRRAGQKADCRLMAGADSTCIAMASYRNETRGRVYYGSTVALRRQLADAISEALRQCNEEKESDGRCAARTTVCADGGHKR